MKIVTVVGARPQFVKAAAVSRAIRVYNEKHQLQKVHEVIVHTGQHYDENMSQVFFDELDIPRPDYNLEIGGGTHGAMTGQMLEKIEHVLMAERPDWVLIYGDTNSTLAGALAASKLHIPIAHVEAGLRSFNMRMPEEINRILSDRVSTLLFCPTEVAVANLKREGIEKGVCNIGDVMYDASLFYRDMAKEKSTILQRLALANKGYVLVTCHRAENTDDPVRLKGIVCGLASVVKRLPVVFPLHPRTKKMLLEQGLMPQLEGVIVIEPVSFLDMVQLEESAKVVVTDSGGVQKEACFFNVPCVTMRDETEWVETVESGWNRLACATSEAIMNAIVEALNSEGIKPVYPYGNGDAAQKILETLVS
ncbi:UDP-N-acetylglucosamine 2-epimerase (non-hydrolyzing) [Mariprofundus erugo]|uniref:non-hydrolyzing UDP-N-acetylglucosamine 2-epimerase n=1 Tax=Mariprofundus erugo TaxID=2528639 RepID=UPI0010FEBD05|nr:UDP-N-acetylglucosamine 2-epimerase (non-hydrolyzing) [Mariprofundus erugo]TLS76049.1 UDP-N-acetylglucosamine 2-epimerase (non-hydrolyzing) [Mariprofundus erugo]